MDTREERVEFLLDVIKRKKPHVIAVDGPCASGKTTLVEDLRGKVDFSLISMDDFFLPPDLRSPERFREKGGNVHYERFIEEVITPLTAGISFTYHRYSCRSNTCSCSPAVNPGGLIIVEGSYALHPEFPSYWDLSFFLTVDSDEQIRRLEKRSPDKLDMFISRWIPLENEYFEAYSIRERASFVL